MRREKNSMKNAALTITAVLMFAVMCLTASTLEVGTWATGIPCACAFVWLCLFGYANLRDVLEG